MSKLRHLLYGLAVFVAGCGPATVIVDGQFPSPVVEPLPLTLGIWYEDAFSGHEFFDQTTNQAESDWLVQTGAAQVAMWDTVLAGMFEELLHMKGEPRPGQLNQSVDGVLIPYVDELQYTIPSHTNIKIYEIWMRYRFKLVTPSGEPIAEWTMSSYGKTPTAFLRSNEEAVNMAAVMALRDAGANFITTFAEVPELQQWLSERNVTPETAQ